MATAIQSKNYAEAFSDLESERQACEPLWLRQLRSEGWSVFSSVGFPTTRDEDWRFTNLAPLTRSAFRRAAANPTADVSPYSFEGAACRLVFIDGRFAPALSATRELPAGLEISSLAQALKEKAEGVEQHLGRYVNIR